jgi:signal transduction histidine kinase/CheY-like chemotaxis protein
MTEGNERSGAGRWFHGLVVASIIVPLLVFAAGLVLSWRGAMDDAALDLRRGAATAASQMSRTLDIHRLVAARVNELAGALDDQAVAAADTELRNQIVALIRPYPQIAAVAIIGVDGRTLLAIRNQSRTPGEAAQPEAGQAGAVQAGAAQVGAVQAGGAATGEMLIRPDPALLAPLAAGSAAYQIGGPGPVLLIRRGAADGPFRGVVLTIAAPEAFALDAAAASAGTPDRIAGLYRADGTRLAHDPARAPATDPAALPDAGAGMPAEGLVAAEGEDRLVAWHKVEPYPVYATVARSRQAILGAWLSGLRLPVGCGIVALIALAGLSLLAVGRARRENLALVALRQQVARRETAEATLRQAQRLEAIGRLTGGIAHDFNNHLTVISSNVELLKHRLAPGSEGLVRLAEAAMQGVQRAATLTHRLLAFARQQPLEPEPLDVGRLVSGMLDLLRRTLGESIAIRTDLAAGLWPTRVDANQLENVLLNLAINARDAMPEGGTLTISTANVQPDGSAATGASEVVPGQYVRVSVADSGHGMTADVIARAFQPFFSTKSQGEGSGLGLAMVHGFVKQAGGHVHVVSEPAQGCLVTLYLPRFLPAPVTPSETQRRERPPRQGGGETILVVEDDEAVRHATVEVLKELGYLVLEAPDAMEAFRLIVDRGGIDLLFTDVGLPGGVNGHALADAVRNVSGEIRLLFTTGYAAAAGGGGTSDDDIPVLIKPFDLRQLGAVVRAVLDAPSSQAVSRMPAAEKA